MTPKYGSHQRWPFSRSIPLEPSRSDKSLNHRQAVMIFSDVIMDADAQLLGLGMTAWLRSQQWQRREGSDGNFGDMWPVGR